MPTQQSRWKSVTFSTCALVLLGIVACGGASSKGVGGQSGDGDGGGGGSGNGSGATGDGGQGNGGSGSSGGSNGGGVSSACIVGYQGCLCDSTGGCAPGLTCTPRSSAPNLCCSGSSCTPTSSGIGATCSADATTAAACTPGITILHGDAGAVSSPVVDAAASGDASAGPGSMPGMGMMPGPGGMAMMPGPGMMGATGTDSCGYAADSFAENTTLCAVNAVGGGGSEPATIQVFYSDEHALTLGCATSTYPVSALPSDPGAVKYPETGDPACTDVVGRPLRPVLYVTDLTADPGCTAGDQQNGGTPYDPVAVFGTWKSATEDSAHEGTPVQADPTPANVWDFGTSADAPPVSASACAEQGYSAELRFEVGLVAGHSYRFQVIVHDGDQNKGGDSGEACVVYCAGAGSSCPDGGVPCTDSSTCFEGDVCNGGCCGPPPIEPYESPDGAVYVAP